MKIYFRLDAQSPSHTTVTVFINHAHCGVLTLRRGEFDTLFTQLRNGAVHWEDVRTDGDGLELQHPAPDEPDIYPK